MKHSRILLSLFMSVAALLAGGGLITLVYSPPVTNPYSPPENPQFSTYLYEQSIAYGGGYFAAAWMQIDYNGQDPRVLLSSVPANGSNPPWGSPPPQSLFHPIPGEPVSRQDTTSASRTHTLPSILSVTASWQL